MRTAHFLSTPCVVQNFSLALGIGARNADAIVQVALVNLGTLAVLGTLFGLFCVFCLLLGPLLFLVLAAFGIQLVFAGFAGLQRRATARCGGR